MATYDHATFDRKWQQYWEREHTFATPTDRTRPKYYVLDMFPYPSGDGLHVGHPRGYTATDVIARAKRMMGFNVLRVMGWDSFGLPAERRAERDGIHPSVITARNIAIFKSQLEKLGLSYDWARELATSDPRYYKWTQWIFELLFERGLAYRAEVPVNFCPALGTVLANEEVHDGKYIETGDPVEKRLMTQWMLRITAYADRLVEELDGLDWPAGTDKMQRDWIGKSIGANATFTVVGTGEAISVFTTRPDTLFGGTYVVLAPEHPVVARITTSAQRAAVNVRDPTLVLPTTTRDALSLRRRRQRQSRASPWPRPGRRHRRCRRGVKSPQAVERWAFAQRAVSESLGTARCAPITCRAAATTGLRTTGSCAICCTAAVFRPDCRPLSARKSSSTLRLLLRLLDRSFIVGG